jgi:predicted DsbA family dithiol-disulfide isomerase
MASIPFSVVVYYDYECPWCYAGQAQARRLEKEYGATIDWQPVTAHPEVPPEGLPISPDMQTPIEGMFERVRRLTTAAGLPLVPWHHMIYTRYAFEATEYARERDKLHVFNKAVFLKLFEEGKDIAQWSVLKEAAVESGLNGDEMLRLTQGGRYTQTVDAYLAQAEQKGIDSLPTYALNGSYAVVGPQPFEVFQLVIDKLRQDEQAARN